MVVGLARNYSERKHMPRSVMGVYTMHVKDRLSELTTYGPFKVAA